MDYAISRHPEFRYKTEFQSHEPEVYFPLFGHSHPMLLTFCFLCSHLFTHTVFAFFLCQFDYLKSLEIEEKINKIRWCQTANGALFLLSTNDKTIKFWKARAWKSACNIFHVIIVKHIHTY